MMSLRLTDTEKKLLLDVAGASINAAVKKSPLPTTTNASLSSTLLNKGASFVTIKLEEQLRGCLGSTEAKLPLIEDVIKNASSAATADPRFSPLTIEELDRIHVEISVLSTPEILTYDGPEDLVGKLHPSSDGVIIRKGFHRATFLPQVWKKVDDPAEFLSKLCLKAHLDEDAWEKEPLEVLTYKVECFHRGP